MSSEVKTKVSIVAISYNQAQYIRQALDSFLMQKTTFTFEIVIADDCSTDETPQIIQEYAKNYPDIIKPVTSKKNVGVMGNFLRGLRAVQGEYIALCECDDYWTDLGKLQQQADFLDKKPGYALCFHPVRVFFENHDKKEYIYPNAKKMTKFTIEELLKQNFIQTNSVMYRKQDYKNIPTNILPVDWYLHLYHAQFGKIGFIDRVMSAYRRHEGGIWWNANNDKKKFWEKQGIPMVKLYVEMLKLYGENPSYKNIIYQSISNLFSSLLEVSKDDALFREALSILPNTEDFVANRVIESQRLETNVNDLFQERKQFITYIDKLEKVKLENEHQIRVHVNQTNDYLTKLNAIYNSKAWRYAQKAAKIKNTLIKKRSK